MLWAVFVAMIILLRFGFDGLKVAGILAAMTLAVFGVRAFLNTFWKPQPEEAHRQKKGYREGPSGRQGRPSNGFSLSGNDRRTVLPAPSETDDITDRVRTRRARLSYLEPY